MNAISLDNLWSYLHGLSLTASNKRWLADHLYESALKDEQAITLPKQTAKTHAEILAEAVRIRKEREKALWSDFRKNCKAAYTPSQEILDIVKDIEPMPEDIDI